MPRVRVIFGILVACSSSCGTPPAAAGCVSAAHGDVTGCAYAARGDATGHASARRGDPASCASSTPGDAAAQPVEEAHPADTRAGDAGMGWYALRAVVWPIGAGSVEHDPNRPLYLSGTRVQVEAVPIDGWRFVEWRGDLESRERSVDVVIQAYTTLAAHFAPAE